MQLVDSAPAVNVNFAASTHSLSDGDSLVLSWNASGAAGCTANGGANGDGWSGALPASGSVTLTESFGGEVKYSLVCQFSGGKRINNSTSVFWYGTVFLDTFRVRWVNAAATLTWSSNVTPCSITGGGLSLSGLPSSGSTSTTQSSVGDVTYNISCGTSPATASSYTTVSYITPAVEFRATGTDRLVGQEFDLYWQSYADICIPSGGAAKDGWTSSALGPANMFSPIVSTAGVYTYNLTCSSGPNQVTQSVTVTLENNAPYTTLTIAPTTVTYSASAADYATISWKSNLTFCSLVSNPRNLTLEFSTYPLLPSGAADAEDSGPVGPGGPGDYVVSMTCTGAVGTQISATSAPVTLHVLPPPPPTVQISTSSSTVSIGEQFTINWLLDRASDASCSATHTGCQEQREVEYVPLPAVAWSIDFQTGGWKDARMVQTYGRHLLAGRYDPMSFDPRPVSLGPPHLIQQVPSAVGQLRCGYVPVFNGLRKNRPCERLSIGACSRLVVGPSQISAATASEPMWH
jgi:hypothetical protein